MEPVGERELIFGDRNNLNPYNLVILSEGYTWEEQEKFLDDSNHFYEKLKTEDWFCSMMDAVSLYRIFVPSWISGKEINPGTGNNSNGDKKTTYFKASFYPGSDRILWCDHKIAKAVLDSHFSKETPWHSALILVNTELYGGSGYQNNCPGGRIAAASVHPTSGFNVALHELGHAAFGLADEYETEKADSGYNPEDEKAIEPNVIDGYDEKSLKWKRFINLPVPTWSMGDPPPESSLQEAWSDPYAIGVFQGAKYSPENFYRPNYCCKMRAPDWPFCRVCVEAIIDTFRDHFPTDPYLICQKRTIKLMPGEEIAFELYNTSKDRVAENIELISTDSDFRFDFDGSADNRIGPLHSKKIIAKYTKPNSGSELVSCNFSIRFNSMKN